MKISIVGAATGIGRAIALLLLHSRSLCPHQILQLVGEREEKSFYALEGLRSELMDSVGDASAKIELAFDYTDVDGEIVIMADGLFYPVDPSSGKDSDAVRKFNIDLMLSLSEALKRRGIKPLIAVVTAPIEAGVMIFSRDFGNEKVIGIGAYLDSLRFKKEISLALDLPLNTIQAMVIGEHGPCMMPLWSSVKIEGLSKEDLRRVINELRRGSVFESVCLLDPWTHYLKLLEKGDVASVLKSFHELPLSVKLIIRPWIAGFAGIRSAFGPAGALVKFLIPILRGDAFFGPLQIMLEGEFHGVEGPFGAPVVVGFDGVKKVVEIPLWEEEREVLKTAQIGIKERLKGIP